MSLFRLVRACALLLPAAIFACVGFAGAQAQDSAQSNAAFWLQEKLRLDHLRPARQQQKVRRLIPNAKLARPTIWGGPTDRHEPGTRPPLGEPGPEVSPIPGQEPAAALPQESSPGAPPPQEATPGSPATPVGAPAPSTAPGDLQKADVGAPPPAAPTSPAPAPVAATEAAIPVAVIGDNVGYWLAVGLNDSAADDYARGDQRFTVLRKTRDSSGLVRDDFYDWQKNLRDLLAGADKIGAVVIMIGSNDRQELRDANGRYEPLTPRWRELYTERVDALLAKLKDKNIPFFWVGLPIMRAERYSTEIAQLNEIYRARAEAAGGKFIDVWDAFADESGRYNVFGPDVNGQIVKLRTGDGIHFTKAGARKLAYFTEQGMRSVLERQKPAETPGAPAPAPGPVAPNAPPPGSVPQAALQPTPAPAPEPPPKPLAGPVLPLTAPPLTPGGELAGGDKAARSSEARATVVRDLADGKPAASQPGRADDFSWPRR